MAKQSLLIRLILLMGIGWALMPNLLVAQRQGRRRVVANQELSAVAVNNAIRFGVDYLKNAQLEDGSWAEVTSRDGGTTAMATLALINAGVDPNSKRIRAAISRLRSLDRVHTYVVALRIMVLVAADAKGQQYRTTIQQDVQWLLQGQLENGGWSYAQKKGRGDASNSQFAILALHEATSIGIEIPRKYWERASANWKSYRGGDGGFMYRSRHGGVIDKIASIGSMTCAGIASTLIIDEQLLDPVDVVNGQFAKCCDAQADNTVEKAIEWLAQHYTVRTNPYAGGAANKSQHLYYLYALERAGRFSGRRFIGNNDWYRDGAQFLLMTQQGAGSWQNPSRDLFEDKPVLATSYCLLFLSKGKRPVAIGKFDHGANNWDIHPRGVHYLTRKLEKAWGGQKLNWQTVKADGATADDLFETPVLFMSGQDFIGLNGQQKKVLKKYIESGGFLFAEACNGEGCTDLGFDKAFKALMRELFPDSELELLDTAHPIWVAQEKLLPSKERPLFGLQACCRTSVVYCPANLSCYWALAKPAIENSQKVSPALKKRVKYATDVGVNVVSYATGRVVRDRLDTPKIDQREQKMLEERSLVFPKIQHGGGADDAPNAWRKLLREVKTAFGFEVDTTKKLISPTKESLIDHPFVFMHGRNAFSFSDDERKALREYLEMGGFIFADSICASSEFSKSFRDEVKKITGSELAMISPQHAIWNDPRFGRKLTKVTLRIRDSKVKGGFRETVQPPQLEGIEFDGRLAIVFSPNDISCALENTTVSNCTGYTRDDALRIAARAILYSLRSVGGNN